MKSEFNHVPGAKAFSFGIAREAYSKVYIKEHPARDPNIPGPGQYPITPLIGNEAAKYTLRPKTTNPMFLTTQRIVPGPGAYDMKPSLNEKGNYFLSKYRGSLATTFDPPQSMRFKDLSAKKQSPGPGTYESQDGINKQGSYFVSKFMSTMCRTHYHSDRNTLSMKSLKTPGPGNYRLPSDFGYYEAKKKFISQKNSPRAGTTATTGHAMGRSASQPQLETNKKETL